MKNARATVLAVAASLIGCFAILEGNEADRDRRLQPERVLDAVGLKPGMTVAEVGAGRGYFTVKLARRVSPTGMVYANDIDSGALEALEGRCDDEHLDNITIIHGDIDNPRLPDNALDMVFLVYALHDFSHPVEVLENLRPSLRSGARVVVLDHDPAIDDDDHFLPAERVVEIFSEAGYRLSRRHDFLEKDFLMVFECQERLRFAP